MRKQQGFTDANKQKVSLECIRLREMDRERERKENEMHKLVKIIRKRELTSFF